MWPVIAGAIGLNTFYGCVRAYKNRTVTKEVWFDSWREFDGWAQELNEFPPGPLVEMEPTRATLAWWQFRHNALSDIVCKVEVFGNRKIRSDEKTGPIELYATDAKLVMDRSEMALLAELVRSGHIPREDMQFVDHQKPQMLAKLNDELHRPTGMSMHVVYRRGMRKSDVPLGILRDMFHM